MTSKPKLSPQSFARSLTQRAPAVKSSTSQPASFHSESHHLSLPTAPTISLSSTRPSDCFVPSPGWCGAPVVPALGLVLETQPGREPSEKARLQVTALCQDAVLAGPLAAALGRAAAAGRHTEFCLSRLAELSARRAPADAPTLLDAYTALACGHVAGEAVSRDVLPALRYMMDLFERRAEWAIACRQASALRGNLTNNYAEATMCIIKDIVMKRCKARTACELVMIMDEIYNGYMVQRLIDFALDRRQSKRLAPPTMNETSITRVDDHHFRVTCESDPNVIYNVAMDLGVCSCPQGQSDGICKHQLACSHVRNMTLPQAFNPMTAENRRWLMMPGVGCLLDTFISVGSPQADVAAALIRDFDQRVAAPPPDVPAPAQPLTAAAAAAAAVPAVQQGMVEVRSRVTKMLSSTAIQSKSSQLTGLFRKK
ncbi:hypothetical protein FJT64_001023 [Amphibalanus amphitrite]|uniref:SWIM-type domain-containing protein n=1 Tax=Amphibalanus amphitrite TaxID=1232801 RepID=A0A6A4V7B6_AMPAM|nr:hypothetical protein FJT64_001023 [Amphibalanus amphitrite]